MKNARNLRHHGRFALTVDTSEWPYKGVTLQGSATIADSDQVPHDSFATLFILGGYDGDTVRGDWGPLVNFFTNRIDAQAFAQTTT